MGYLSEDGTWGARKLGKEHTSENASEVERLYSEHPRNERDTVLRMDRLLGQLMPLRAFGDFRFKVYKFYIIRTMNGNDLFLFVCF